MRTQARPALAAGLAILVTAAVPAGGGERSTAWDPCRLLSDREVQAAQGAAVEDHKRTEQANRSFRTAQCFYRTATLTRSVSVAIAMPLAPDRSGPRTYWRQTFRKPEPAAGREEPPRRVTGLGEEAFWVGDRRSGALYVLDGDVFLRLSVGGIADEAVRIQTARRLADSALRRLRADLTAPPPRPGSVESSPPRLP